MTHTESPLMISRATSLILLVLFTLPAWGADKYLNCDCANDGNGASASCAASGGGAGAWNTPASLSLSAGDTLTGSGTCYARMSITGGSAGNVVTYAAPNGITLDSSVSVDGANTFTANTPPAVYGSGSSWQLVSGEVYKKGSAVEWYMLREDGARLTPRSLYSSDETTIVASLNRGEWTVRNATTDTLARTIYYRASDGRAPSAHALRANNRQLDGTRGMLSCNGQDYWRMTGTWTVQYHHVSTTDDAGVDILDCDNYDTGGAIISQYNLVGANIDGGSNGIFDATVSRNISSGLAIEGASATLTNLTVRGTYDYNGGEPRYNGQTLAWNGDGDGIGVGQDGGTIAGLTIAVNSASYNGPQRQTMTAEETGDLDRGSGIYVGTAAALTLTGLRISGGLFEHNHRYGLYMGDEPAGWSITSTIVRDTYCNPSYGGNGAVRTATITSGSPIYTFANNVVWGNTCAGGASFATSYASATWNVQNNVFGQNRRVGSTWFGDLHIASSAATRNETNNQFFNTSGETQFWRFGATLYTTLAAWQTATSGGTSDQYADPQFIGGHSPTTVDGFRLKSTSPLIGAGIVGAKYDFDNKRCGNPSNIGAFCTIYQDTRSSYSIRTDY